jgi:hypothetical protein
MEVIAKLLPIIIIFLLFVYTDPFIEFADTILGKLIALVIIIFYTTIDVVYGTLSCVLILLFYQSDLVEKMLNINEGYENIQNRDEGIKDYTIINESKQLENKTFAKYDMLEKIARPSISLAVAQQNFKKSNCKNGVLKYKNIPVRSDIASHIFPEVVFNKTCNPCDDSCSFSIIEEKINTEDEINTPHNSNEVFIDHLELQSKSDKTVEPSIGLFTSPFSFLRP